MSSRPKNDLEIPMTEGCGSCSCGTKQCGAVRHIEDLAHEVDVLRGELRRCERQHSEDCRKLWYKIGAMLLALAVLMPAGWTDILAVI